MPFRNHSPWCAVGALTLLFGVASPALALDPPEETGRGAAIEQILASWEATDARLTALLDETPTQAHQGIQRAIEANRAGRERALAALESAGSADPATARERAQQALADAATKAQRGLDEARQHVPEHVLPKLDQASAKMQEGIAKGAGAVAGSPPVPAGQAETRKPQAARPDLMGRPDPMDRPSGMPSGAGRPDAGARPRSTGRPGG